MTTARACCPKPLWFMRSSALLLLLLLTAAPLVAGPTMQLRFKAQQRPYRIATTTVFDVVEEPWQGAVRRGSQQKTTVYLRRVGQPRPNILVVRRQVVGADRNYSLAATVMTTTGELLDKGALKKLRQPRIHLEFPARPLAAGDTWSYVVPASIGFPAPTTIKCRLATLEAPHGEPLATVQSLCTSTAPLADGACRAQLSFNGRLTFDVSRGRVVSARTKTTYELRYEKEVPHRDKVTTVIMRAKTKIMPE